MMPLTTTMWALCFLFGRFYAIAQIRMLSRIIVSTNVMEHIRKPLDTLLLYQLAYMGHTSHNAD
jgi:hypothetical protein